MKTPGKTSVDISVELRDDIENVIADRLKSGKSCGNLRLSDSHEARIQYLFNFWKNECVYENSQKREFGHIVAQKVKEEKKKKVLEDMKKMMEGFIDGEL